MAIETDTERAIFLDADDFGQSVTYTPNGGGGSSINAIFDQAFFQVDGSTGALESSQPMVTVLSSDVTGIDHGDTFTIAGTTYNVVGIQPDGQGMTEVLLEEQ